MVTQKYVRENAKPARKYRVNLFSRTRIEVLVTIIIMVTILSLMAIPIYILSVLTEIGDTSKIRTVAVAVLGAFTVLFSIVLASFTRAKRHEILGAAAA